MNSLIDEALLMDTKEEFDSIPPMEELEKMYKFSEEHERRMKVAFSKLERRKKFEAHFCVARKVAVIILAIAGSLFAAVKVIPPVCAYVATWITENADDRMIFKDNKTEVGDEEKVDMRFELGYVPEGYELVEESCTRNGTYKVLYKNCDGEVLRLFYASKSSNVQLSVDIENASVERVSFEGIQYYVFENKIGKIVVWEKGEYLFEVKGDVEKSELINIVTSVRYGKDK